MQKDGRVLYLRALQDKSPGGESPLPIDAQPLAREFWNLPYRNMAVLMLGTGTSITDSAIRLLAESGVLVTFFGGGGSPLHAAVDQVFLSPQSEYRPTEYMHAWMSIWLDPAQRLRAARELLRRRLEFCRQGWAGDEQLGRRRIWIPQPTAQAFEERIDRATTEAQLLSAEGAWVKALYVELARGYGLQEFRREERVGPRSSLVEVVNGFLTHGNYIAYGYAAASLYTLGVSFALPALHGSTRRGGLVFDIADLVKDWTVLPIAFEVGAAGRSDSEFRARLIGRMQEARVMDRMFDTFKFVCGQKFNEINGLSEGSKTKGTGSQSA